MLWHNGKAKVAAVTSDTFRFFDALIVGVDLTLVRRRVVKRLGERTLLVSEFSSFSAHYYYPLIIIINLTFIYIK